MVGAVGVHAVQDRQGDGVARRQLVGEALAGGVEQRRALAAHRLGHQQPVGLGAGRRERGRVELAELEVGQVGSGGVRHHRRPPRSRPRGWWCGPRARRRRRWRGPWRGRGPSRASVITPWQRSPSLHRARAEAPSATSMRGLGGRERGEPLGDRACPSRRRPRARRAGGECPPSSASSRLAVGVAVELDPAALELLDDAGRLGGERLGGRARGRRRARRRPCRRRAAGRVVVADRGRQAALGPVARALAQGLARDHGDPRAAPRPPSAPSAGPAAPPPTTHDVDRALLVAGGSHGSRLPYPPIAAGLYVRHPSSLRARHRRPPRERPAHARRSRRRCPTATGWAWSWSRRPAAEREQLLRVHDDGPRRLDRAALGRGAAA